MTSTAWAAISVKGTTREPRFGNPAPRIAETPGGMLNAVGLQNPGIEKVLSEELPRLRQVYHKPILANISGFSLDEYVTCCAKADASPHTDLIEVNVSCPNVHHGGMSFGTDPRMVYDVTQAVKEVCQKPVYIKLSPNVTDIVAIAKACADGGADGLSLINTLMGMRIDLKERAAHPGQHHRAACPARPSSRWPCGWSGRSTRQWVMPIIGMGGVQSARGRDRDDAGRCRGCARWARPTWSTPMPARRSSKPCPRLHGAAGAFTILKEIIGGAH